MRRLGLLALEVAAAAGAIGALLLIASHNLTARARSTHSLTPSKVKLSQAAPVARPSSGCSLAAGDETKVYLRMPVDEREELVKDLHDPRACESTLDLFDLAIDPDRTSPDHTCHYSLSDRAALASLPATAQIPLTAHPCFVQEDILRQLATAPEDQRARLWEQLRRDHPEQYGAAYLPETFAPMRGDMRKWHKALLQEHALPPS